MSQYVRGSVSFTEPSIARIEAMTEAAFQESHGDTPMTQQHKTNIKRGIREGFITKFISATKTDKYLRKEEEPPRPADSGKTLADLSSEDREKVEKMLEQTGPEHNIVYPRVPTPADFVIPTGGLAKCACSPNCQIEIPEPAYRFFDTAKERDRWSFVVNPAREEIVINLVDPSDECIAQAKQEEMRRQKKKKKSKK